MCTSLSSQMSLDCLSRIQMSLHLDSNFNFLKSSYVQMSLHLDSNFEFCMRLTVCYSVLFACANSPITYYISSFVSCKLNVMKIVQMSLHLDFIFEIINFVSQLVKKNVFDIALMFVLSYVHS